MIVANFLHVNFLQLSNFSHAIFIIYELFYNFPDVSLHILDQHNYPVVQYNEHFGLLESLFSSDSGYFSHAIFIFMTFIQLSLQLLTCLLNIFRPTQPSDNEYFSLLKKMFSCDSGWQFFTCYIYVYELFFSTFRMSPFIFWTNTTIRLSSNIYMYDLFTTSCMSS